METAGAQAGAAIESPASPVPNTCTEQEAAELLKGLEKAPEPDLRDALIKLLMSDRAGGEILLKNIAAAEAPPGMKRADAWELVNKNETCFRSGQARVVVVELLMRDEEAGKALLKALPVLPKAEQQEMPPPPQHDPMAGPRSAEAKAAAAAELIKAVQKEGRYTDYSNAREEARRRNPTLFS